jgi:hypothetical protein
MYERKYKSERILVICSFHKESMSYRLPKGYDPSKGQLLLDNYIAKEDMKGSHRRVRVAGHDSRQRVKAGVMKRLMPYEAQVWKF